MCGDVWHVYTCTLDLGHDGLHCEYRNHVLLACWGDHSSAN